MSYNSSVMLVQEFNKEKFINVLLFFLDHANNARLGETKLMKLFYFLDFGYFQLHQKSVTGAMYVHYQHGPIPSEGKTILNELVKKKIIKCVTTSKVRYPQKRFLTNCLFNEDLFDEQELQHMWAVVIKFDSYTAKAVEEMSHNEPPWIITKQGEYIDYNLANYRNPRDLTYVMEIKAIAETLDLTDLIFHTEGFLDEIEKAKDSVRKDRPLTYEEVFGK